MATVKRRASFEMDHPAAELFPLFTPEGEKLWVPSWDYENTTGSAEMREDLIYLTSGHHIAGGHGSNHHWEGHYSSDGHRLGHHSRLRHGETNVVWLVKNYDPARYRMQLYRVEPDDKVAIISLACKPLSATRTEVAVTYEYCGLSKRGNDFVARYSAEVHQRFISHWPAQLAEYFAAKADE